MDNLTHALLGAALVGLKQHSKAEERAVWLSVMFASQAPDFDLLPGLLIDQARVAFHRGYSHSWLGLAVIVGFTTLLVGTIDPRIPRKKLLVWSSAAVLIHICFDLLTSYGTSAFLPFSNQKVGLDVLFIVEIPILVMLGVGVVLRYQAGRRKILAAAVLLTLFYIGGKWTLHDRLFAGLQAETGHRHFSVLPDLNPGGTWNVVVDEGSYYQVGTIKPGGKLKLTTGIQKNLTHPLMVQIKQHPVIDSYLAAARYPYAVVTRLGDSYQLELSDLRLWPHEHFKALITWNSYKQLRKVKLIN